MLKPMAVLRSLMSDMQSMRWEIYLVLLRKN
jgi:hypothetical protein